MKSVPFRFPLVTRQLPDPTICEAVRRFQEDWTEHCIPHYAHLHQRAQVAQLVRARH